MLGLKFSKPAITDVEDIYDYSVNEFGVKQADFYLQNIDNSILKLRENPLIGRKRDEIKKGLYSFSIKKHIIYYRLFKNHIRIVRLLHTSRDHTN